MRHPLILFFALSYALTWPGWWLEARGPPSLSWLGSLAGYYGPAMAAVLVTALSAGREGLEALFARTLCWRVAVKWYLAAAALAAGSVLAAVALSAVAGRGEGGFDGRGLAGVLPQLALVLVFGSLYGTIVAAGEEIGWRGYALPLLLQRHSALAASLIVGIFTGALALAIVPPYLFNGCDQNRTR